MGNLVKYGSFDIGALDRQDQQVAATTSVGADFMKLQPGRNKIRFLPPGLGEDTPFALVHEHFLTADTGQRVRFACARLMDSSTCPACEEANRLKRSGQKGNPLDRDKAKDYYPKLRIYANVIDRDQPTSPKILAFGKMVWEGLKRIRRDRDDGGDFTDPTKSGFDVVINREGTGKLDTVYSVAASRNCTPLDKDPLRIDEITDQRWDLKKYSYVPPLEEALAMMQNGYQDSQTDPGSYTPRRELTSGNKQTIEDTAYDVDSDDVAY